MQGLYTKAWSVKHTNAIAHATSRATSRRFFKHTILSLPKHTSVTTYASAIGKLSDHFQNCYIFVARRRTGCRASHVALDVALVVAWLVCGQSRDFSVCRRVPRRARVGVFYT